MNSVIFLIIILSIYFYLYKNHYDKIEEKYHNYFYVFNISIIEINIARHQS